MKNYPEIVKTISENVLVLRQNVPDTLKGFSEMAQAATKNGALDQKTKELMALAIGVAARCDGCIGFHLETLVRLGARREELEETLAVAVYMGGGPSLMYAADAMQAHAQFSAKAAQSVV